MNKKQILFLTSEQNQNSTFRKSSPSSPRSTLLKQRNLRVVWVFNISLILYRVPRPRLIRVPWHINILQIFARVYFRETFKPLQNGEIIMSSIDLSKSCPRIFNVTNMYVRLFANFRKISKFTV